VAKELPGLLDQSLLESPTLRTTEFVKETFRDWAVNVFIGKWVGKMAGVALLI
jgi:hypothetical protein